MVLFSLSTIPQGPRLSTIAAAQVAPERGVSAAIPARRRRRPAWLEPPNPWVQVARAWVQVARAAVTTELPRARRGPAAW